MRLPFVGCFAAVQLLTCNSCLARPVSLADLERISAQPDVTVDGAPDGTVLAMGWNGKVMLIGLRGKRTRTDLGPGFDPTWAPNSRLLAFYSKRSGTLQLWVWERAGNTFRQLTNDVGGLDVDPTTRVSGRILDAFHIAWAPDGTRLAFASRVERAKQAVLRGPSVRQATVRQGEPMVLTDSTAPGLTLKGILVHSDGVSGVLFSDDGVNIGARPGADAETQIRVIDVQDGRQKWITRGAYSHFYPAWSPDGSRIACVSVYGPGMRGDTSETQIAAVAVPSGKVRDLTVGAGVKVLPMWTARGDRLVFSRSRTTFSWERIYAMDVGRAQVPVELHLVDRSINKLLWSPEEQAYFVSYKDGVSGPLARIRPGTQAVIFTERRYPADVMDFSVFGGGAVVWVQSDPRQLWTVRYLRKDAHTPVVLLRLVSIPPDVQLGRVRIVHWRNRAGQQREGTILLPPGFRRGVRYPLIVDAYPLLGGSEWTSPMFGNFGWAGMGYAVFRPSPRAPHVWVNPWKTEASSAVAEGPDGWAIMVDDVMSGVDELIAQGIVDPNRMCLYGFSNGGGVVDYLVTRVHRFRCAVSVAPALSDWVRPFLLNSKTGLSVLDYGKDLEAGLSDYIALSAVFHLSSVQTPMLLADGDEDGEFLLDAVEMYNRLRQLGKPVTLVRYPNQDHGFTGSALSDFWDRETAFFARYLRPHESVSDATISIRTRGSRS